MNKLIGISLGHVTVVAVLGLIGLFVWNFGVVSLSNNLPSISYLTATAIMLGIYMVNYFINIQVNRIMNYRQQKYMIDKIIKFYKDNATFNDITKK